MPRDILKSMRPHQWVKNSFVLAPLVFSQNLTSPVLLGRAVLAALLFCVVSGAVYMINDLMDLERDREHPTKRQRPIASGRLPIREAKRWAFVLVLVVHVGALILDRGYAAVLAGYFVTNLAYSLRLKHIVYVDVSVVAIGFLLRVVAGALAIDVPISIWLVVCTFLISLYLALGKRKHELLALRQSGRTRRVLEAYQLDHVKLAMFVSAVATTASYTAYTFDSATVAQFDTNVLPLTIPFIVFGLARFYFLTERVEHTESPTEQMIRDRIFVGNVLAWGVVVMLLIYT